MRAWKRVGVGCAALAVVMAACTPPEKAREASSAGVDPGQPAGLKRIAVAILGDPQTLSQTINTAGTGSVRGVDEVEKLIAAGTGILDDQGLLRPQLAEAVPTVENGLWTVLPDGSMRTTWRIKEAAQWHDGAPVPQRAEQLVESVGYAKRPDGKLYDGAGQQVALEARTSAGDDLREKILFAVADYWRQLGIDARPYVVPDQLAHDSEYRAHRPAFELVRQPFDPGRYHSAEVPSAEKRWRGNNRTGYVNLQLDTLIDQYFVMVSRPERIQVLGQIVHHLTDNLVSLGILYSLEPMLIGTRLVNVAPTSADQADETWNAHLWDVK